jgi:peptidoglycan/LPS O-acetylase OafA/YrhL
VAGGGGREGRFISIDLLRAFAIAWVVLFHLWGDIEFFPGQPRSYYDQLTGHVRDGAGLGATFTAFTDLFFRDGYQGVPLFMIISGISLTIAAYRAGDALRWHRFLYQRLRKLMLPYWVGVVGTYAVIAVIAWRQASVGDGAFSDRFTHGVTIARGSVISIDWGVAFASATLIPRLLQTEHFFAPQLALWFVGLIAQYYLLFPLLLVVMRRVGVALFLVASFALTVGANWWIVHEYGAPEFKFALVTGWAPFRIFEFTAGMAIGWLLVDPSAAPWLRLVRHPAVCVAAIATGFAAHTAGDLMIGEWTLRYWQSLALPLVTLGLALMALPLVVRRPSRSDSWLPFRAVATLGVMSYAVLIVNDAMRLVASQLRLEGVSDAWWWFFLTAVYIPASVGLAWPLARMLGLLPRSRPRAPEPVEIPPHAAELEPVPVVAG